jgi:hypothetical protein
MVRLRIVNDGLCGHRTKVFYVDKDGMQTEITHCKIIETKITLPANGDNEAVLKMYEPGIDIMAELTGIEIEALNELKKTVE